MIIDRPWIFMWIQTSCPTSGSWLRNWQLIQDQSCTITIIRHSIWTLTSGGTCGCMRRATTKAVLSLWARSKASSTPSPASHAMLPLQLAGMMQMDVPSAKIYSTTFSFKTTRSLTTPIAWPFMSKLTWSVPVSCMRREAQTIQSRKISSRINHQITQLAIRCPSRTTSIISQRITSLAFNRPWCA